MNQQRSRRFRAAQEARILEDEEEKARNELIKSGREPDEKKEKFDSNCITPGTPFMMRLAECLRYYITERLNKHESWKDVKILLSDASVPGEGEHKIMDFIRKQRLSPRHDPNTSHVLYGLDADLIMLALATHEPHFKILREDVFLQDKKRKCYVCESTSHIAENCPGISQIISKENSMESAKAEELPKKPFIFLHVNILREYLEYEMHVPNLPFHFEVERAIDDWVFLCFFVGNDFLPHLPSLEIREGAIDKLINIYKKNLGNMGCYLTKNGDVDLYNVQLMMEELGRMEDGIFIARRRAEERRQENARRRKEMQSSKTEFYKDEKSFYQNKNQDWSLQAVAVKNVSEIQRSNRETVLKSWSSSDSVSEKNKAAAKDIKDSLFQEVMQDSRKRKADDDLTNVNEPSSKKLIVQESDEIFVSEVPEEQDKDTASKEDTNDDVSVLLNEEEAVLKVKPEIADSEPFDEVRLWEDGWRERYYSSKFGVDYNDVNFRKKVVHAYVEGLCWVLKYYYQGCPSWKWFYPFHYPPFASDFEVLDLEKDVQISFDKGIPFKPFEQLMGVLPAHSKSHIPKTFHPLMTEPDSEIIDFYPESFEIDLNGKKYAWQGVALLPFIDEKRLIDAMEKKYDTLDEATQEMNRLGNELLFIGSSNPLFDSFIKLYTDKDSNLKPQMLNPNKSRKMTGYILPWPQAGKVDGIYKSPLKEFGYKDIANNHSIVAIYIAPKPHKPDYKYPALLLPGVKLPERVLTYDDYLFVMRGPQRRNRGHRDFVSNNRPR